MEGDMEREHRILVTAGQHCVPGAQTYLFCLSANFSSPSTHLHLSLLRQPLLQPLTKAISTLLAFPHFVLSRKHCGHFTTKMINPVITNLLLVKERNQIPRILYPKLLKRDLFCDFRAGAWEMTKQDVCEPCLRLLPVKYYC